MKKTVIVLLLLLPFALIAQKTKVITINYKDCKDTYIFYLPRQDLRFGPTNSMNHGDEEFLDIMEWTWDGNVGQMDGLLYFDLSSVPSNMRVVSAKLSIYKYQDRINQFFSASKSYALKIQKITSVWDENTVTWNNKPSFVADNQIIVPDSADLTNIDITVLVKEWVKNPNSNFGMMISCAESRYYRGLSFASSEYPDKSMRPKLVITLEKNGNKAPVAKSPKEKGQKKSACNNNQTLIVYDLDFTELYKEKNVSSNRIAEIISELDPGKYMFQLISTDFDINSFQIIKK